MRLVRSANIEAVPASHENPESPGVLKKVLLHKTDFIDGRIQMINWAFLPQGQSFTPHYHEDMQETFILIKGEARIVVDDEQTQLCGGDVVVVPVGSIHSMENVGKCEVEYIVVGVATGTHGKTIVV